MECDYNALIGESTNLRRKFNNINNKMLALEDANKKICSNSNWNSQTRDYYNDLFNEMKNNFDTLFDKFNNINNYLETVINNYKSFDRKASSLFGG